MNYVSLLALCSLMLLLPSCGWGRDKATQATQTEVSTDQPAAMEAGTEVKEETAAPGDAKAAESDKENLEEAEQAEEAKK